MHNKLGVRVVLAAVSLLFVHPAAAYLGKEHAPLGELGLRVALERYRTRLDQDATNAIRSHFLCDPEKNDDPNCIAFGKLVAFPDLITHVERLLPRPDDELKRPRDRESAEARCRILSWDKPVSDTDVFSKAAKRIDKNPGWKKFAALHGNVDHFELCAATRYNDFHGFAVRLARRRGSSDSEGLVLAVLAEGVALHFLQDSFAPGHLLTPRANSLDLLARMLHNRHNDERTPGYVAPDAEMLALLGDLNALQNAPEIATLLKRLHLNDKSTAIPNSLLQTQIGYLGDGSMSHQVFKAKADLTQGLALVMLTARSIGEVIEASIDAPDVPTIAEPLRVEFKNWTSIPGETPGTFNRAELIRPSFQLMAVPNGGGAATSVAGFRQGQRSGKYDRWAAFRPELTAAVMRRSGDDLTGYRYELGFMNAGSGVRDIENRNDSTRPFTELPRMGLYGMGNICYEKWGHTSSLGSTVLLLVPARKNARNRLDLYYGFEFGGSRYESPVADETRGTIGGRFGLGMGVLFLDIGVRRIHRFETDTHVEPATSLSVGARIQIPY